ncbi:MAG: nicotinate (nicotinamide) nucleotide adenylyltransferase [Bacteroides sp.]
MNRRTLSGRKIGIYSGSFNPVHIGHLALANYLCEFEGVDEVWFLVTPHNPLKEQSELMDDELRLRLVQLAVEGYPRFRASDFEFHLPRPSYSIHTLEALRRSYPDTEFTLIIGSDNWLCFDRWFEAKRIVSEFGLLIYPRPGFEVDEAMLPPHVRMVHAPCIEVSSTFVRQALRQGKDVRFFLPAKVYDEVKMLF